MPKSEKQKQKKKTKRDLVADIRKKGVSARKAAKAANAVLDAWKFALWCGEEVEVPGGILQAKTTKGTEWATLQHFQNIHTKEPMVRMVHTPGRRKVVKLKPDPSLGLMPDPPPPPPPPPIPPPPKPPTAEEMEAWQLVSDLLGLPAGKPIDPAIMAQVHDAVGAHPRIPSQRLHFEPGALMRRLRFFKSKRLHFWDVGLLTQTISEHNWL